MKLRQLVPLMRQRQLSFGAWLRRERQERGISLRWLADRAGVAESTLSLYERSRIEPARDVLDSLIDELELDRDEALLRAGFAPDSLTPAELLDAVSRPRPALDPLSRDFQLYALTSDEQLQVARFLNACLRSLTPPFFDQPVERNSKCPNPLLKTLQP